MSKRDKQGVFISYARKDGEAFATKLREWLERRAPDLGIIWQDRSRLEGGTGWWKQITDAIDKASTLVLVMSHSALQSPTVRKEWCYARGEGVRVIPLKAAADLNFDVLPLWMRKTHFHELPQESDAFLRDLRNPSPVAHVPFMAPDPPEHFVRRSAVFEQLRNYLLQMDGETPIAIAVALLGAGGFGKTTLASALCHDGDIQTAFDDGILWVTLGQTPNIVAELATLYAALTGERPGFLNEEDASYYVSKTLGDRNCLLVIDDVWSTAHLAFFLRGGQSCARLITTRNADVAPDARQVNVDEMTSSESVEMLTEPGSRSLQLKLLARLLGHWPLLLNLARGALRRRMNRGDTLDGAISYLNRAFAEEGVEAFDHRNSSERNHAVGKSIEISLRLLNSEERRRYLDLTVFPGDINISLAAVRDLWGSNEFGTEKLIESLDDLSLLEFDLQAGTIRLHDVIRQWLCKQVGDPASIHRRLVAGWCDRHHLPHGYAWRWLSYHLLHAGARDELRDLLLDFDWVMSKLEVTDFNALIGDFQYLKEDTDVRVMQGAIRLSAHVLAEDKTQLASQLLGRCPWNSSARIQAMLRQASKWKGASWLKPLTSSLTPPGGPLRRTLSDKSGPITAVSMTADGQRVLFASGKTIQLWDVESGTEVSTMFHNDWVRSAALSADGRWAISASYDKLKVWDLDRGVELYTFGGHPDSIAEAALSADGNCAVSVSHDGTMKVWNVQRGTEVCVLCSGTSLTDSVAISADGKRAIVGSKETLVVWDLGGRTKLVALPGHAGNRVWAVAMTADGRRAISASMDKTLKLWDVDSGLELFTLSGHTAEVSAVTMTADGKRAVSASWDDTLRVWDLESGKLLNTLLGHSRFVTSVAMTADGKRVVSGADDNTVKVWDLEYPRTGATVRAHCYWVDRVAMSRNGRRAVSSSAFEKSLQVWDAERGEPLLVLRGHTRSVTCVAISADGNRIVSGSKDGLKVWNGEDGSEMHTLTSDEVSAVALSGNGSRVISGGLGSVRVWDVEEGAELFNLRHPAALNMFRNEVRIVALDDEGLRAVSIGEYMKIWDLRTGSEIREVPIGGHADGGAISADGQLAISAAWDERTIRLFDVDGRSELCRLAGHREQVREVCPSLDWRRAVSVSDDHKAILWNLKTGELIATFTADAGLRCCSMTSEGHIVVGDELGTVHFLRLEDRL